MEADMDVRISFTEYSERLDHDCAFPEHSYAQMPQRPFSASGDHLRGPINLIKHVSRCLHKTNPRFRQLDTALCPFEKLDAEFLFEHPDLVAQRGLRHIQALRRASEVQLFSDCNHISEMAEFHLSFNTPRSLTNFIRQMTPILNINGILDINATGISQPDIARDSIPNGEGDRHLCSSRFVGSHA
jgi:hypothetical protein